MITADVILEILRLIVCGDVLEWLRQQAEKSETPIDDLGVELLEKLLCK